MNNKKKNVSILLSGGLDSTTLIEYYKQYNYEINGIHFQYNQSAKNTEWEACKNIANYYDIEVKNLKLGLPILNFEGQIQCRNSLFIFGAAANIKPSENVTLAYGAHSGTPYYDCSINFVSSAQTILDGYFGGTVSIEAPFIRWSKEDILKFSLMKKVPIELTYSCEKKEYIECGKCPSCLDRRALTSAYKEYLQKKEN
ncbi:7-cyano-7-deazaguanine synthase [Halobacillus alkaliphilus]|uniref:7-cyano-7-deazaguanine synthase n=1 Tax=Halobacillus alkaliphilus TaxID=396056 RepID=A0A1I2L1Z3_9BACI|nr:7-cyano-7-deazaguanine synthase [Halobacillus alkaliphilus]SFF72568.1 7-cyano-7-deazaguanine synthase [Halobacillus alkaliphilus]